MGAATDRFFEQLARRGDDPRLRKFTGTVRFDLAVDGHIELWFLDITAGRVTVTRDNYTADAIFYADLSTFDRLASGEISAVAAWLSTDLEVTGEIRFLIFLRRVLPAPPHAQDPRELVGSGARP